MLFAGLVIQQHFLLLNRRDLFERDVRLACFPLGVGNTGELQQCQRSTRITAGSLNDIGASVVIEQHVLLAESVVCILYRTRDDPIDFRFSERSQQIDF